MAIPKHGPVAYEVDCVHHGGGVWPAQIVARVHTFYFLVYTLSQWCCRTASAVPRALDEDEDANSWAQGDDSIAQNIFDTGDFAFCHDTEKVSTILHFSDVQYR